MSSTIIRNVRKYSAQPHITEMMREYMFVLAFEQAEANVTPRSWTLKVFIGSSTEIDCKIAELAQGFARCEYYTVDAYDRGDNLSMFEFVHSMSHLKATPIQDDPDFFNQKFVVHANAGGIENSIFFVEDEYREKLNNSSEKSALTLSFNDSLLWTMAKSHYLKAGAQLQAI